MPDENKADLKYYRHLQNRGVSFKHIARFRGTQMTNKGQGIVFDLVRDYDGNISKSLEYYLKLEKFDKLSLAQHVLTIKQYLLDNRIVFRDITCDNIVLQKINKTQFTLIIVDGLGSKMLIPIENYVNFIAVKAIHRRFNRLIERGVYGKLTPILRTLMK